MTYLWLNSELPVMSEVPQGRILAPILFNIFTNNLHDEIEGTLIKFAVYAMLRGQVDAAEGRATVRTELSRANGWANNNYTKFNKEKFEVLHLAQNNSK